MRPVVALEAVIGVLAAVVVLGLLAARVGATHPAVLVLAGLVLGMIPGLPTVRVAP